MLIYVVLRLYLAQVNTISRDRYPRTTKQLRAGDSFAYKELELYHGDISEEKKQQVHLYNVNVLLAAQEMHRVHALLYVEMLLVTRASDLGIVKEDKLPLGTWKDIRHWNRCKEFTPDNLKLSYEIKFGPTMNGGIINSSANAIALSQFEEWELSIFMGGTNYEAPCDHDQVYNRGGPVGTYIGGSVRAIFADVFHDLERKIFSPPKGMVMKSQADLLASGKKFNPNYYVSSKYVVPRQEGSDCGSYQKSTCYSLSDNQRINGVPFRDAWKHKEIHWIIDEMAKCIPSLSHYKSKPAYLTPGNELSLTNPASLSVRPSQVCLDSQGPQLGTSKCTANQSQPSLNVDNSVDSCLTTVPPVQAQDKEVSGGMMDSNNRIAELEHALNVAKQTIVSLGGEVTHLKKDEQHTKKEEVRSKELQQRLSKAEVESKNSMEAKCSAKQESQKEDAVIASLNGRKTGTSKKSAGMTAAEKKKQKELLIERVTSKVAGPIPSYDEITSKWLVLHCIVS